MDLSFQASRVSCTDNTRDKLLDPVRKSAIEGHHAKIAATPDDGHQVSRMYGHICLLDGGPGLAIGLLDIDFQPTAVELALDSAPSCPTKNATHNTRSATIIDLVTYCVPDGRTDSRSRMGFLCLDPNLPDHQDFGHSNLLRYAGFIGLV